MTHTLKGAAGTVGLGEVVDLSHRLETALACLRDGVVAWHAGTGDRLVEIVDGLLGVIDASSSAAGATPEARALGELIDDLAAGRPAPRPEREAVPEAVHGDASSRAIHALDGTGPLERGALLRVEAARIDELMSSAGELLFDRTRIERRVQFLRTLARDLGGSRAAMRELLARLPAGDAVGAQLAPIEAQLALQSTQLGQMSSALLDEVEALRRTIGDLQGGLTRVRMQTARSLFLHLARAARAVSRAAGARVELRTSGEDTEFDKTVAERLVDPLIQLLRNAIVHGLEPAAERVLHGKPATGVITLRARQEGSLLVVELADDGRGIDPQPLRDRLVATGRWSRARAQLASEEDLLAALFDPGVSSRDDADELAGRGIGLDLVREGVARLGGEVRLTSTPGRGTAFTLRLPLSTAVSHAMLFKVGGQVYALPNVHAIDTGTVEADATTASYRGHEVPVVRLETLLHPAGEPPPQPVRRPAVMIDYAGRTFACTVDKLVGPREIVLKPLGPLLEPLALYTGATISASGKVQLILDTAQLARRAYPDAVITGADPTRMDRPSAPAGRVLVVDDSRAIREAMASILAREGWIVDVAEHGARALAMTEQVDYDLVVTDLEMPELSGWGLIEALRQRADAAHIPILIVTSRASPDHRRRARDLGVRELIAKPITRHKLLDAVAKR
ncbi:MAG: response regulator [Kofleriaceae bacterium]